MSTQQPNAMELLRTGVSHHTAGRFDEAARLYEEALAAEPVNADGLHLLGVIAHQRGDQETAIKRIRQAIAINGDSAAFHSNLGIAYRSAGRTAEAVETLRRAVELDSASAGIRYNLANALTDAREFDEAIEAFRYSLAQESDNAGAWTGLGNAWRGVANYDESRRCHEQALSLSPAFAAAHHNLGLTFRDEGNLGKAVQSFLKAAAIDPGLLDAHISLGNVYEDVGEFARAIAAYDRALRLDPSSTSAAFNRALTILRRGDLRLGWSAYEARWRHNGKPRRFSEPEWDGSRGRDKTILVYSEQGIGDEVMFASCFAEVIGNVGQCLIECDARLVRLFARSFPSATIFPRMGEINPADVRPLPRWDVQIASGSLPKRLRNSFDSFPAHAGYLIPDPDQVRTWRARYDQLGAGLVVGISWQGGKDPVVRRQRSTRLKQWGPLFQVPGIAFVNLQYGDCRSEVVRCREDFSVPIHEWDDSDPIRDLDGFAAQIAALDLVISVDNSTVHLAGALNVPAWTLLHFACDWRWFEGRDDSPWYPSLRLFRQARTDGSPTERWSAVFERAATALREFAAARADAAHRQGLEQHNRGCLAEAVQNYERVIHLQPENAEALNNLGVAWKAIGRPDYAFGAYQRAVAIRPGFAPAWFNLGNAHREEGRLDEAIACYGRAHELTPDDIRIPVNLSVALRDRRQLDEAEECLKLVLRKVSDLPEARFNQSLIDLIRGNLSRGWDEYEWRLRDGSEPRAQLGPRWDGLPLDDRTLLVLSEQGIGDQVMFASCLSDVASRAKCCYVECDARLVPLLERSLPGIRAIARTTDPNAVPHVDSWDVVEFLGSLPRFVRRRVDDFPKTRGYLKPDSDAVAKWRSRLARLGGAFKVGIAWRGGKDAETQRQRSVPLELWQPILQVPGVRFVNLQHGPTAAEAVAIGSDLAVSIDDGSDCDPLANLDDFAAKIAALDLVLSVDNSTVHLAAALGRPVWTLLPLSCDWRWMVDGQTSPWYPTMRLLRCRAPNDWSPVLQLAARLLTSAAFTRDQI